jgi:hypothetical protein
MSPEVEAARAGLLARGVIVLDEERTKKGVKTLYVASMQQEWAEVAVPAALGDEWEVHWISETPRRITPRRLLDYSDRGMGGLKLGIVLHAEEHVDEVVLAEDDEKIVVAAYVCRPALPVRSGTCQDVVKVCAQRDVGGRLVIDFCTGEALRDVNAPIPVQDSPYRVSKQT